jgi:hypothetical protein
MRTQLPLTSRSVMELVLTKVDQIIEKSALRNYPSTLFGVGSITLEDAWGRQMSMRGFSLRYC